MKQQMEERYLIVVARREFATDSGALTLEILRGDDDAPAFAYRFTGEDGGIVETLTTFGLDDVQALLFCVTAAGDYLRRFVPSASFADLGVTGLLTTDLSASTEWRAQVSIPTS
ncbi:hypothetical protein [Leifsonia sp. ALI-44-B]|jgi:hypothetical protein|uniref:hypothetical protein n=1 Tax=Leifsonia sp. ALI-44-B TaxID=1933776 RepID=UPI00117A9FC1|nr:hypothetical protein [Leifsonia sp. ALI-44-B]